MAQPENIARFQEVSLLILRKLFKKHPSKIAGDPENFYDHEDLPDVTEDFFYDTLDYLVRNGCLDQDAVCYAALNEKSWALLNEPNPLDSKKTLGQSLIEWSKDAASSGGKNIISAIGQEGFKILLGSFG